MISGVSAVVLVSAVLADALFGDPPNRFHPVSWLGQLANGAERLVRVRVGSGILAGGLCFLLIMTVPLALAAGLLYGAGRWHPLAAEATSGLLIYFCIALRGLDEHAARISAALDAGDLPLSRQRLSWIVSRETAAMEEPAICRATVESVAENFVDGFLAPVFYALLLGPLAAVAYRAINTLDAMFGYRNERYLLFGRVSARVDDVANFIPARLSVFFLLLSAALLGHRWQDGFRVAWRDLLRHASPNSGHPESAVAGALGVQLGGPSVYFGVVHHKDTLGDEREPLTRVHIERCRRLVNVAGWLAAFFFALIAFAWHHS